MLLIILACAHPTDVTAPPASPPRVPSLQSVVYVHHESVPTDALVARVWGSTLDEALSGAAGSLAMRLAEDRAVASTDLRWRAVLAGYPWRIVELRTQRVAIDEVPEDLLAQARAARGRDLGLVRARGRGGDQWVLLQGERTGDLPAFSRETTRGQRIAFPAFGWVAVPPSGVVRTGRDELEVDESGEWLVALIGPKGEATAFPLYVDRATPQAPPFAGGEAVGDAEEEILIRLEALDRWYRRSASDRDTLLDGVARARLRTYAAGEVLPPAEEHLAAAGFRDGTAAACKAATVVDCLDAMWWSTSGHAALATSWASVGMAVQSGEGSVSLVITAADRRDEDRFGATGR